MAGGCCREWLFVGVYTYLQAFFAYHLGYRANH